MNHSISTRRQIIRGDCKRSEDERDGCDGDNKHACHSIGIPITSHLSSIRRNKISRKALLLTFVADICESNRNESKSFGGKMRGKSRFLPSYVGIFSVVTCFCFEGEVLSFQTAKCSPHPSRYFMASVGNDDQTEWGVTADKKARRCPMTPIQVANDVFDAIAGTLYDKQKPDPAIPNNARSTSLLSYRPTRASSDEGRIGIELDGAEFMFPSKVSTHQAFLKFSLILAAKLSHNPSWKDYEDEKDTTSLFRPIVISYKSVDEALLARKEMDNLKSQCRTREEREAFGNIIIQTISNGLPEILWRKTVPRGRKISRLSVEPKKGLLMIVQPTDFNTGVTPHEPSLNTLEDFQSTTLMATVHNTPTVVLSPRFNSYDGESVSSDSGVTQSSFQKASYYGGREPMPKGPEHSILRDYSPPSYSWVGDALSVNSDENFNHPLSRRVILTNSVMDEDHPWHLYSATFEREPRSNSNGNGSRRKWTPQSYYLGSTRSVSGRPTYAIMKRILDGDFDSP